MNSRDQALLINILLAHFKREFVVIEDELEHVYDQFMKSNSDYFDEMHCDDMNNLVRWHWADQRKLIRDLSRIRQELL